jgi:catechol 2,3-dioxygenase-like lactoylglutathione lyase family enzyme
VISDNTATTRRASPTGVGGIRAGDVTGVFVAMLPVSDLASSAAWYRDLLGLEYAREFERDGVVTGCALYEVHGHYGISFRLRSTTAGQPDLRGEHPIVLRVRDRSALDRIHAHAAALGYAPTRGTHRDAAWVEVIDPDGIATRFACSSVESATFTGVHFDTDGASVFYHEPKLKLSSS